MELNQVTLPAVDVAASVAFYRRMGFTPIVDEPHYARFKSTEGDATFSLHAVTAPAAGAQAVVYFECASVDDEVARLKARGIQFLQEPRDEPWLWREARLVDPTGNVICLYHAGRNRLDPPWRVGARDRDDPAPIDADERAIRDLVATWMAASRAGDVATVLSLMTDDAVFLVPGRVMRKDDFAAAARAQAAPGAPHVDGASAIEELIVLGTWAFMRARLTVEVTPQEGAATKRAGHTLTIFRKEHGRWRLARDANLLAPVVE